MAKETYTPLRRVGVGGIVAAKRCFDWRNQPFGRRRQQRRRIWIAPFWRGPEDAEIIHRDYRVDKEQS